jgi:3-oxo-5-alpha-steroid 4-dehydrogenase 1
MYLIDKSTFDLLVWIWTSIGLVIFMVLLTITAPYGRHSKRTWGATIPDRIGWFIMEVPALIIFLWLIITGTSEKTVVVWIISALYVIHYINRAVIYPWRIRTTGKRMPLVIALMAVCFNFVNAFNLGYYTGSLHDHYSAEWLRDPRFISGLLIFFGGMAINMSSDEKLIHLRVRKKNDGYQIPRGGLFEKVSCPNFMGEIVEWGGYALLCWSLPAFSFFIWTFCNLVPRALSHHKWYRNRFPEYPRSRRAVFPYIL